jgi:hypothetical protein
MQFCIYTYKNYQQLLKLTVFLWSWCVKYFRTHVAITVPKRIQWNHYFLLTAELVTMTRPLVSSVGESVKFVLHLRLLRAATAAQPAKRSRPWKTEINLKYIHFSSSFTDDIIIPVTKTACWMWELYETTKYIARAKSKYLKCWHQMVHIAR